MKFEEVKEKVLEDLEEGKIVSYKKYENISRDEFLIILKQLEIEKKI